MCYNHISKLLKKAATSIIDKKLAACIIKNGKIIGEPRCNSHLHAEHTVINNVLAKLFLNNKKRMNYDIMVVRINKYGTTSNARPCNNCLNIMKQSGIRKVYYSVENNTIVCENVQNMISIHKSSITRMLEGIDGNPESYYEALIKKYFPPIVRKFNLKNFINYNLNNVLPRHKVLIANINVCIMDCNNNIVIKSILI